MAPRKTMAAPAAAKTAREEALEQQLAEMRGQLQALMAMGVAGAQQPRTMVMSGKPLVGIRNISSYTVSIRNTIAGEEGDVTLHPANFRAPDPNSTAIISHQLWMTLRKSRYVAQGLIVRDDSIVSDSAVVGPDDREDELPREAARHQVADPFTWIESKTDDELRTAIAEITSEPTLRRLAAAVDHMIWKIGEERYKDHEERAKFAIRDCPSKYRFVDTLIEERLLELDPLAQDVANERKTEASFRG